MNRYDVLAISLPRLRRLTQRALRALGLSRRQATIVTDVLLYAQMRGNTQGLIKIVERTIVPQPGAGPAKVERIRPAMARIVANGELGMVVLHDASELLIELAGTHGMATVATVGTNTSSGALGYYARRIARQGLIAVMTAGSPKTMALHGGVRPVLGSNAMAIAMPRQHHDPLVLDMTTAAAPVFALHAAHRRGEPIDAGLALDEQGEPTTDPAAALRGALLPFGGAKGSALALMLECLSGPLAGGAIVGDEGDSRGNFLLAMDPGVFAPDGDFDARLTALLHRLAMPEAPGTLAARSRAEPDRIKGAGGSARTRLPGAASDARENERLAAQSIELDAWLFAHLRELARATRSRSRSDSNGMPTP